ncbi:hypothetical protein AVEN_203347-1 [Araneus ventricosus]|uniref:Uncharacterized protein n=1 Tax=Araneus ventricosus TaxID=182803 RepID=A0A4Y2URM5_ARAVE|nr:hypothetical protein AVEN_203347-1 [Araneus ventricosus]
MKDLPFISPATRGKEKRGKVADESIPQINYSLKNQERLRHGNKRQRRDRSPQPVISGLQSGCGAASKRQRCDPMPQPVPRLYNQMLMVQESRDVIHLHKLVPPIFSLLQVIQFEDPETKSFPVPPF